MANPKLGVSSEGPKQMHYSVGALICRNGKYLFLERKKPPFGLAGIAGHVDEGEDWLKALIRELMEEGTLMLANQILLFDEELDWNTCRHGIEIHHWQLYECEVLGEPQYNPDECASMAWYTPEELRERQDELEPVWRYWLQKKKVI